MPRASLGFARAVAGNRDAAVAVLDELLTRAESTYVSPIHIAMVHAGLGNGEAVFEWLEEAYRARARGLAWLPVMREFDAYRADPRYAALIRSIGIDTG